MCNSRLTAALTARDTRCKLGRICRHDQTWELLMKLHFFPRSRGTSMNRAGRHLLALFTACVLISAPAAAAGLATTEQDIVALVRERSAAALQLLERTVNVN